MTEKVVPHYDVVIATPGHSMKADFVKSLLTTTKWLTEQGMTYHFVSQYSSFVPNARENTATDSYGADWEAVAFGAGKFTYKWILWIDSDISWKPEDVGVLLGSDKDIISGMVAVGRDGRIGAMRLTDEGHPKSLLSTEFLVEGEPVEVDGVGFGFLAVRSGVFETMSRPWFRIVETPIAGAEFPVMFGEDYSWCRSAVGAGYQIWLHPLVRVEHHKEVVFTV